MTPEVRAAQRMARRERRRQAENRARRYALMHGQRDPAGRRGRGRRTTAPPTHAEVCTLGCVHACLLACLLAPSPCDHESTCTMFSSTVDQLVAELRNLYPDLDLEAVVASSALNKSLVNLFAKWVTSDVVGCLLLLHSPPPPQQNI